MAKNASALLILLSLALLAFPKSYSIPHAGLDYYLQQDGSILAQESITYSFESGSFRELYVQKPLGLAVSEEGGSCDGVACSFFTQENMGWRELVLQGDFREGQTVTATFSYRISGQVLAQKDASQFFYKLWGDQWQEPVGTLEARVHLPGSAQETQHFMHPYFIQYALFSEGPQIGITSQNHPAETFMEINLLMPRGWFGALPQADNYMSSDEIAAGEEGLIEIERQRVLLGTLLCFAIMALLPISYAALYLLQGAEKHLSSLGYQMLYEREPPTPLSPTAAARLIGKGGSRDWLTSEIMNLVQKKFLSLSQAKEKGLFGESDSVTLALLKTPQQAAELENHQQKIFGFLHSIAKDGQLTGGQMKAAASQSANLSSYMAIEKAMQESFNHGAYANHSGNYLMSACIASALFLAFVAGMFFGLFFFQPLLVFAVFGEAFLFLALLIARPMLLGKWNGEGRVLEAKWQNFHKFLNELTLMRDKTAPDIVLWEQYLVYATAFGIAGKVRDAVNAQFPSGELQSSPLYASPYAYSALYGSVGAMSGGFHGAAAASGRSGGGFGSGGGGGGGGGGAR